MKLQASSIYRNTQCLASAHIESTIPYEERYNAFKDAASFGSQAHDIAEQQLRETFFDVEQKSTLKAKLKKAGLVQGSFEYDKAFTAINEYVKYVKKISRSRKPVYVSLEEKYRSNVLDTDLVFKCDAMLVSQKKGGILTIDILDLKTGNFDYFTSASLQMWFSILIYLNQHHTIQEHEGIKVNVHVVQPNYWMDSDKVRITEHKFVNRGEAVALLYDMVTEIKDNKNAFKPGDWCKMCPAILRCPEGRSSVSVLQELSILNEIDLAKLTPTQLEAIYSRKAFVETFLKAIEQQIMVDMEKGTPGYEYVNIKTTRGHRHWIDEKRTERILKKKIGTKVYAPKKILSVAQMEKLAGKKNIEGMYEQAKIKKLQITKSPFDEVE